jgi:hypothetical protein
MIALDLYVGENSLANYLSSPKGSACTRCVQMSLHLVPGCQPPGESGPDGATVIDVFSPVRSDWNDTPRLAVTEGRWP